MMRPALKACTTFIQPSSCHPRRLSPTRWANGSSLWTRQGSDNAPSRFNGYNTDTLDAPLHSLRPPQPPSSAPPPSPKKTLEEEEDDPKLARARVVFGSRLAGPAQRRAQIEQASSYIAGILVPPKPEEPDNCCMSGCVNCVWDQYREELEEWAGKSGEARARARAAAEHGEGAAGGAGDGGALPPWKSGEQDSPDLFADIPVGIREFMKTEKKLKARHRAEQASPV